MFKFALSEIARVLGGTIEGDPNKTITSICTIDNSCEDGLSFLSNPKYTPHIYTTKASAVIVSKDFTPTSPVNCSLIRVDVPYSAFGKLLSLYNEHISPKIEISPLAFVSPTAKIGKDVYIGEFAVICDGAEIGDGARIYPQTYVGKNSIIGNNSTLYPGVKVMHNCKIGSNCLIQPCTVIGSEGFGFSKEGEDITKIPQIGTTILNDDVELGANCCVDRGTLGETSIGEKSKLNHMVVVAHNCTIGKNTLIAAQVGIAGSSKVGNNCTFGGQAGIVGHISVADGTMLAAKTGLSNSVRKENTIMGGYPAIEINNFRKSYVHLRNIDALVKRVDELERQLSELKGQK